MKRKIEPKVRKQDSLVIAESEFRVYLVALMGAKKVTVKEFADELGVSVDLLYLLMQGKRKPSPAMLKKLGLEVSYRIRTTSAGEK